jgi:hypothetical protein
VFTWTINKAQGQIFKHVRIHLPSPVLSHGKLNMTLFRISAFDKGAFPIIDEADNV